MYDETVDEGNTDTALHTLQTVVSANVRDATRKLDFPKAAEVAVAMMMMYVVGGPMFFW